MSKLRRYRDPEVEIISFTAESVLYGGDEEYGINGMEPGEGEIPFESVLGGYDHRIIHID